MELCNTAEVFFPAALLSHTIEILRALQDMKHPLQIIYWWCKTPWRSAWMHTFLSHRPMSLILSLSLPHSLPFHEYYDCVHMWLYGFCEHTQSLLTWALCCCCLICCLLVNLWQITAGIPSVMWLSESIEHSWCGWLLNLCYFHI